MAQHCERVNLALRRHVQAQRRFEGHAVGSLSATLSAAVPALLQPGPSLALWATAISTAGLGAVVLGFLWEARTVTESAVRESLLIERTPNAS
jgi:hypothetical protein